jgi:gamma-glutamylaminecyclotransferase
VNTLLFVYGTLKRGCGNHHHLAGQTFAGMARTQPGYCLYDLGGYPGLVASTGEPEGVVGEVWSVDPAALAQLDAFEGVREGLYRRAPITLQPPFADQAIHAYLPVAPVTGRREIGSEWRE